MNKYNLLNYEFLKTNKTSSLEKKLESNVKNFYFKDEYKKLNTLCKVNLKNKNK